MATTSKFDFGLINDQIKAHTDQIGDVALPTTAQTLTGAIAENYNHIDELETDIALTTTTTTGQTMNFKCSKQLNFVDLTAVENLENQTFNAYETKLLATFPLAYAPSQRETTVCLTSDKNIFLRLIVNADGTISVYNAGAAITSTVSLITPHITYIK